MAGNKSNQNQEKMRLTNRLKKTSGRFLKGLSGRRVTAGSWQKMAAGFVLFSVIFAVLVVMCPVRAAAADGYWKLRRTVVYKPEYSNQHQPGEGYWQEVINANVAENEQSTQVKSYQYLGGEDRLTSEIGAVSKCDSPPETIQAGEKIELHFSMNVSFTEYTYDSVVIGCEYSYFHDSPDFLDKHPGNRSGIDAEPVTAGGPIKCYYDAHPDPYDPGNVDACDVYITFPEMQADSKNFFVHFRGVTGSVNWEYEWVSAESVPAVMPPGEEESRENPRESAAPPSGGSSGNASGQNGGSSSGNVSGGSSSGGSSSGSSGQSSWNIEDDWDHHHEEWEEHADPFDTIWRSFLDWLAALLFGAGIGGTLGGGLGGAAGGAAGGAVGGFPGGPEGGTPKGPGKGETPGRRPWIYEDRSSAPKDWNISRDGDISYRDPVTDEYEKFELTGYDPETGEPQYINQRGLPYTESMIRENYENRSRNSENLRQDEETGKRWAEEQREQNRAKWDLERETGRTETSEAWKEDQAKLKREEYLDDLAWKHGKKAGDLKGIKKDILQKEQKEAKEFAEQMAKDEYYGAAEKTAEQVEQASDIAIDVLGEVTGPVGKNIKNAYNFAKPGLKNLAEAKAEGKDVYGQMEALAYGTAEGAINVLQNEVDGIGMKVGGDTLKAGLDAHRKGEDVGAAMEAATFKSVQEVAIEKGFSFLGKKASDYATAGKTQSVGAIIDSAGEGGLSFKNLAGNTAKSEVLMKKAKLASDTLKQIQNTEKVLKVTETLTKDIYLAANDDNFTASAEATQAYVHNARMDTEFGKQISRKHAMMREKGLMKD